MHPTSTPSAHTAKQVAFLRKQALAYPETHEDFPWGHSAFKVRGKAFAFLHADAEGFSISVKLPDSNALALHLPFAEPTGYGLGKSGWVTARFKNGQVSPQPVLSSWLEESYTAVAPKRLVTALLGTAPEASAATVRRRTSAKKKAPSRVAAKKPAAKRPAAKQAAAKESTAKKPAAKKPAAKKARASKAKKTVSRGPAS
jgi:predicted DNA-binding protein (MmcQ/YjbR family)